MALGDANSSGKRTWTDDVLDSDLAFSGIQHWILETVFGYLFLFFMAWADGELLPSGGLARFQEARFQCSAGATARAEIEGLELPSEKS